MKRLILPLLVLSVSGYLTAQSYTPNETMLAHHVKSVSEYETVNGKRRLVRYNVYDREGYNVLQQTVNYYPKRKHIVIDTFVFYSRLHFTRIAREKNDTYDSTVYRVSAGPVLDTTTEVTYKRGKIVSSVYHLEDDLPQLTVYSGTQYDPIRLVHTYSYEYDSQRRITGQHEKTMEETGSGGKLRMAYGFVATYDAGFIVKKHYTEDSNPRRASFTTYTTYDHSCDSMIMFKPDGSIDYTSVYHRDEKGRDTLRLTINGDGSLRYRTVIAYDRYDEFRAHHDGQGLFKTVHVSCNENDMVSHIKETETRTDKVLEVDFVYTYHEN